MIPFATLAKAKARYAQMFAGRPGCKVVVSNGNSDNGLARGAYIACPPEVAAAWDRGLDKAKALPATTPDLPLAQVALVNAELDAVAPRA